MINMMDRLIIILLLQDEHVSSRDEAAMSLSGYDDPLVQRALIQVAADPHADRTIARSCGLSLAEIWTRQDIFPSEIACTLSKDARFGVKEGLGGQPAWLELYEKSTQPQLEGSNPRRHTI